MLPKYFTNYFHSVIQPLYDAMFLNFQLHHLCFRFRCNRTTGSLLKSSAVKYADGTARNLHNIFWRFI